MAGQGSRGMNRNMPGLLPRLKTDVLSLLLSVSKYKASTDSRGGDKGSGKLQGKGPWMGEG